MAFDVSVDMGSSGALCEDINNPCRETELIKLYDKLRLQTLPKHLIEIKKRSKTNRSINEVKEKEKLREMVQVMFSSLILHLSVRHEHLYCSLSPKTVMTSHCFLYPRTLSLKHKMT